MTLPRHRCHGVDTLTQLQVKNECSVAGLDGGPTNLEPHLSRLPLSEGSSHGDAPASSDTILLIVPDSDIRALLGFVMKQQGFGVLEAGTGGEGINMTGSGRPGSVLVDMDVTNPEGLAVIKQLRELTNSPILALAGRVNPAGVVEALDCGANDFIGRPFRIEEICARLRAARRYAPPPAPEVFRSGSLIVDLKRRIVRVGERIVSLSATEYSILQLFIQHAGLVLTHAHILREIWGSESLSKVNCLRVYLLALRKKLENPAEPDLFLTEHAVGYRLVVREATQ